MLFVTIVFFKQNLQHKPLLAKYGGWQTVTLIPGDGIGPELATTVQDLFK